MTSRYRHTILVPKEIIFEPDHRICPYCGERIQKHIVCEDARWHVHSYSTKGIHCSELDCEDNHSLGKCYG
jgi:uncharacterized OB-fold protein